MKKYFLPIVIIFIVFTTDAQTKFHQGYYVNSQADTIYGSVAVPVQYITASPNYELIQWKIMFIKRNTDMIVVEPSNILGYGFLNKENWHHYRPVINDFGVPNRFNKDEKMVFVRFEVSGKLNLISFYESNRFSSFAVSGGSNENYSTHGNGDYANKKVYLWKKGGNLQEIRKLSFRKDIQRFFAEYPDLRPAISTLKRHQINNLIMEYNKKSGNC